LQGSWHTVQGKALGMIRIAAIINPQRIMPWLLACLFLVFLVGCAARDNRIADLAELPQAPSWYAARVPGADWQIRPGFQKGLAREWRGLWFAPWFEPDPQAGAEHIRADGEKFLEAPGYGENLLARQKPYYRALIKNSSWENYPNAGWRGITIGPADLRLLPSARPVYSAPEAGEGFPFDRVQQTSLPPNTPIFVHHQTKDRAWLLVQSPLAWGWLEASRAARMAQPEIREWTEPRQLAITGQEANIYDLQGRHLFQASLGSVLPLVGQQDGRWLALCAVSDPKGRAVLLTAQVNKEEAEPFPIALSAVKVAGLAENLMGQAYGWGGLFGDRDCSALVRDLFAAFGLWLPRNSTDQAHEGGRFIDLSGLGPEAKKRAILREGIPFLTLIWMQGHIMLYVGVWQGEPLVLQNIWALRTNNNRGTIGRAVITTLEPGRQRADLARPDGLLINRVAGMTLLAPGTALEK